MALLVNDFPAAIDGYMPECKVYNGRAEWLDIRRGYTGGSEAAALLGASMWGSVYSLYMEKTGATPPDFTDSTRMQWGRRLEYSIRDGIAEDLGYDQNECLYTESTYFYRDGPARLGSTPDAVLQYPSHAVHEALGDDIEGPGVFEIKNVDGMIHNQKWTDDEPPLQYIIQLQHYMAVMGYTWGVLGALVGGNQPYVYFYRRHDPTIANIIVASKKFWQNIEDGKEPPVDGSTATEKAIKARYPRSVGDEVDLTGDNELPTLCSDYLGLKKEEKDLTSKIRAIKNKLMDKIGDAGAATTNGFVLKAPSRDVAEYVVAARTQRTLTVKEMK